MVIVAMFVRMERQPIAHPVPDRFFRALGAGEDKLAIQDAFAEKSDCQIASGEADPGKT